MNGNGGPIGYVYNQLKQLLSGKPEPTGPASTYSALTGRPKEYSAANAILPTYLPSYLTPLEAATTRVTGIQALTPTYEELKRKSILTFNDKFRREAVQALDEPVRRYLLSENPDFSKFLASVDPNVRASLAGRFLSHLFARTPEKEREIIGRLPFNDALRDTLFLKLIFHLYPGVADIAADQLADEYYRIFGPIVNQMSPADKRLLAEKYVDMFGISGKDREKAISQILLSPRRTTLAAVVASGGYSIDQLKDFLAGKVDDEQIKSIMRGLTAGRASERVRPLYSTPREGRGLVTEILALPQTRIRPQYGRPITEPSRENLIWFLDVSIKDLEDLRDGVREVGRLELVHGELAGTLGLIGVAIEDKTLSDKELARAEEVVKHLYERFGGTLPGISPEEPTPDAAGLYLPRERKLMMDRKLSTFFHELAHGLTYSFEGSPLENDYYTNLVGEIIANAFSIAATAYVYGKDDHPLVILAKRAGLLPGGAKQTTGLFDWVIKDVIPYVERAGPSRSALGDVSISVYRKLGRSSLGRVIGSDNFLSPLMRDLARPLAPNVDDLERAHSTIKNDNRE